jgi:phosphohistidine phosphatase SixA
MRLFHLIAFALLGCGAALPAAAADYYVMRHLQKAEGPDPALSAEGAANARRLATWFKSHAPKVIFVSATRRARETAAPLAARLKLALKEYDPRDTPGLVARVKAESGSVLIVGHSNTVPEIVEALGGARPAPLAETDFGAIWHVRSNGKTEMKRLY